MITNNCEDEYRSEINNFFEWCDRNFFILNIQKNKEIIFDFWMKTNIKAPVEVVHKFKYLRTLLDDNLNWDANIARICKQ